ncbi:MAG: SPOR domain-containing protein [Pseudomonadota bacterium]
MHRRQRISPLGQARSHALFFFLILLAAWTPASLARASDDALLALQERGFFPWADDYAGELAYTTRPEPRELILGQGFLLRLPEPARARQFLVASGTQSIIVDRIDEVGPLGLSAPAAQALGLLEAQARGPVTLQIIALARRKPSRTVTGPVISDQDTAAVSPPQDFRWQQDPSAPEPGGTALSAPVADNNPQPLDEEPAFRWEPAGTAAVASLAPAGKYAWQVGVFGVQANARRLMETLQARNLPAILHREQRASGPRWRVYAGPFASPEARNAARARAGGLLDEAIAATPPG